MGVRTTADRKRDSALDHIREAIRDLAAIVVDDCEGTFDFTMDYRDELNQSLRELIEIRRRLDPRA